MRQAPADPSLGSAVLATPQPRSDGRILPARLHGCLPTAPRALPVAPLLPGHRADVGAWRVWVFFLRIFVFSLLASFLCAGPTTSAAPSAASPPPPRGPLALCPAPSSPKVSGGGPCRGCSSAASCPHYGWVNPSPAAAPLLWHHAWAALWMLGNPRIPFPHTSTPTACLGGGALQLTPP